MASSVASYLATIRPLRILSRSEERLIAAAAARGCAASRRRLIEAGLGFVVSVARRYRNYGVPLEDLVNAGNLGLVLAAGRYDPEAGTRFMTYAVWWVRKCILETLRLQSRAVAMPARSVAVAGTVEASTHAGWPTVPAGTTLQLDHGPEGMPSLAEGLHDPAAPSPESVSISRQLTVILREALMALPPRARQVVSLRLGLAGGAPLTLQDIARLLDLSRERIRQIEVEALGEMRKRLRRRHRCERVQDLHPALPIPVRPLGSRLRLEVGGTVAVPV